MQQIAKYAVDIIAFRVSFFIATTIAKRTVTKVKSTKFERVRRKGEKHDEVSIIISSIPPISISAEVTSISRVLSPN